MLIVKRKVGETIRIGKDITVSVLHEENGSICIGVDAPVSLTVLRLELDDRIKNSSVDVLFPELKKAS